MPLAEAWTHDQAVLIVSGKNCFLSAWLVSLSIRYEVWAQAMGMLNQKQTSCFVVRTTIAKVGTAVRTLKFWRASQSSWMGYRVESPGPRLLEHLGLHGLCCDVLIGTHDVKLGHTRCSLIIMYTKQLAFIHHETWVPVLVSLQPARYLPSRMFERWM